MTLATSGFLSIDHELDLGEASAIIVLCVSFLNYVYLELTLLDEDGGSGVDTGDISHLEHLTELSETSATIVLYVSFMDFV